MIELDLSNLYKIPSKHGLSKSEFSSSKKHLPKYLKQIKNRKQGFYEILDDKKTFGKILAYAKANKNKFKSIVVLGIGGSALGTICLQQSLKHLFQNELNKTPKLYIIDNIDPTLISDLENVIDYKTTLFIVITKSGETIETLSQYYYFRKKFDAKKLDPKKHFVFITDPKKGKLREIAAAEKIITFDIPENVGGRFSVLTSVGLLPAALIDINIEKLLAGAKKQRNNFLNNNFSKNLAFQLAAIQFSLNNKGKNINVIMPYAQKLIRLTDWYKQLLAESIGKKFNTKGKEIFSGITPVNALGVTDQHSQIQLYNEGPNDKLIIFLEVKKLGPELKIPEGKNSTFNKLIQAEKKATEIALTKSSRPNITIKVDSVTEETLGELFMLFEGSIAFLGEFYNINAFNQPGVELGKQLTQKLLTEPKRSGGS